MLNFMKLLASSMLTPHAMSAGKTPSRAKPSQSQAFFSVPDVLVDLNLPSVRDLTSRLRFSPNEGRIWLDERRMVLLHAEAFADMREELIAALGVDMTRGLLTRIGYAAGSRDAAMAWRVLGPQAALHDLIRTGAVMHAFQGFVLPEVIERSPSLHTLDRNDFHTEWIWKHSLEDESQIHRHGVGNHAACWSEVGYSSGFLSACMDTPILVREVECQSTGSPHCHNIAKPVAKWDDAEEDLSFIAPQAPLPTKVYMPSGGMPAPRPAEKAPTEPPRLIDAQADGGMVLGASTASLLLHHKVMCVAPTNATVLLLGESGVGKSVIAREVHRNSRRAHLAFIEVNCAAIPEQLIESELFGVERGAYSGASHSRAGRFEVAQGGTLFLDEIATLSMTAQGKLLRVLQNGEFERLGSSKTLHTDVRVIAATNENLQTAVQEGRFREDLFFRLNVFPLLIQPLRERRGDIPQLTDTLLARFAKRHDRPVAGITARAMQAILHNAWPGNIRELENVLERGVILAQGSELIDVHHLFNVENALNCPMLLSMGQGGHLTAQDVSAAPPSSLDEMAEEWLREGRATLADVEDALTRAALKQTDGNVSRAATLLGVTRAQLDYRIKKIDPAQPK